MSKCEPAAKLLENRLLEGRGRTFSLEEPYSPGSLSSIPSCGVGGYVGALVAPGGSPVGAKRVALADGFRVAPAKGVSDVVDSGVPWVAR